MITFFLLKRSLWDFYHWCRRARPTNCKLGFFKMSGRDVINEIFPEGCIPLHLFSENSDWKSDCISRTAVKFWWGETGSFTFSRLKTGFLKRSNFSYEKVLHFVKFEISTTLLKLIFVTSKDSSCNEECNGMWIIVINCVVTEI